MVIHPCEIQHSGAVHTSLGFSEFRFFGHVQYECFCLRDTLQRILMSIYDLIPSKLCPTKWETVKSHHA